MDLLGKIRRMYFRDKLSLHEITKRTGLSRNTIRRWLRAAAQEIPPTYRRAKGPGKLTEFHATLEQALKIDGVAQGYAHRAKQNRRTAKVLFAQIKADGYGGGYSQLTAFIRDLRGRQGKQPHAFVPLQFELGEAFQFDWGEEGLVVGGIYRRMQVSHLKLCASRAFWLGGWPRAMAYPSQGHEMLVAGLGPFDAHTRSFAALGGIPRRGIYDDQRKSPWDNMKTAVDRIKKGKGRVVNARFAVMCGHYLFDADFCGVAQGHNVASGWEKGIVEKNVQDSRRRIWLDARNGVAQGHRQFGSFTELNAWLSERCRSLWGSLRHPEFKEFSIAEMLEQEQVEMMPTGWPRAMPAPFDGYVEKPVRVSSTCLVNVQRNRYSVPCELAGHMVSTRLYPNRVSVVAGDVVVASHDRLVDRGQTSYDWQHYIPLIARKPGALRNGAPFMDLPKPLHRLRQGLLRYESGDRVMAQVLAAVPIAGLDAVGAGLGPLVAVELVIESGVLSAEHVLNVLARLNAGPVPIGAETTLHLTEVPLANTDGPRPATRYDSLRGAQDDEAAITAALEVDHE